MKPLPVQVVSPDTPVVGNADPPVLVVDIRDAAKLDLRHLRCFVQGQGNADIEADRKIPGRFTVRAVSPLAGRRNKYTLTAPGRDGRSWYWFSQLWVFPGKVAGRGRFLLRKSGEPRQVSPGRRQQAATQDFEVSIRTGHHVANLAPRDALAVSRRRPCLLGELAWPDPMPFLRGSEFIIFCAAGQDPRRRPDCKPELFSNAETPA